MKRAVKGQLKQFEILLENRIGAMADLTEALAMNAVNIKAISTHANGPQGKVLLVTEDDKTAREALEKSKHSFVVSDILSLELSDRPGELAKISRLLSKAGVNMESVYILGNRDGSTEVALKVSDIAAARKVFS